MSGRVSTYLALLAGAIVVTTSNTSCKHTGDFLWVDQVPASANKLEEGYVIKPGDVIGVRVWNQDANSVDRARVREDGKIAVPFLNDVDVAGQDPTDLARRLQVKLKAFIVNPVVTVVVHERPLLKVSVLGEVAHPGMFEVEHGSGVVQALAAAGGMTPFADSDGVFVLRRDYWADGNAGPARIRFRYDDLRRGKAPASVFRLRPGDVVVVE